MDVDLTERLRAALEGDAKALAYLTPSHQRLQIAADALGPLLLHRRAVVRVLQDRRSGAISVTEAQRWASLMKRGYLVGASGPIRPIDIEWEDEGAFVEPLGRLDELGDLVDGLVSAEELDDWIHRLQR